MIIGVPKEIKDGERRVALVPDAVALLVSAGHVARVESNAGAGAGFGDSLYAGAGAEIVAGPSQVFDADLVVKVKEIQPGEWQRLKPGGMLFCFLHLVSDKLMAEELLARRTTGIAFETVEDTARKLTVLAPMSRIAGQLSIPVAANLLMTPNGGRGIAIGDARVVIVGAGNAAEAAAETAIALGSDVTVVSRAGLKLQSLAGKFGDRVKCVPFQGNVLADAVQDADVVIAAVNIPGTATPKLLTRDHIAAMTSRHGPGAVLVEICIDGGGISETSHPTSLSSPTYVAEGVTHYCVANMPAAVPRSASIALSAAIAPHVRALADKGLTRALRDDDGLAAGLQIHGGQVTHAAMAEALQRPYRDLDAMLHSC
ncbi:MAG: alanine dehydrogenase [Betaproteobacteria bacterium]